MMVNRENYEAYLLDLLEGRLAPHEEKELRNFLAQNPDIDGSLPEDTSLHPTPIKSFPKESLRFDQLNEATREHFYIASIEGALDKTQQQQLAAFLKSDDGYQKEYTVFERTVLNPERVNYPNKQSLHAIAHETPVIPLFFRWRTVAAAVLLLVGLGYGSMRMFMNDAEQMYALELSGLDLTLEVHEEKIIARSLSPIDNESIAIEPTPTGKMQAAAAKKNESIGPENKGVFAPIETALAPKIAESSWKQKMDVSHLVLENQDDTPELIDDFAEAQKEENIERISLGNYIVNAFTERTSGNVSQIVQQGTLTAKVSSLFGGDNYVEKKDGKRVKTSLSFGKLKIERIHSN